MTATSPLEAGGHTIDLRDWFAGHALLVAWNNIQCAQSGGYADMAADAYDIADAMLRARSEHTQ